MSRLGLCHSRSKKVTELKKKEKNASGNIFLRPGEGKEKSQETKGWKESFAKCGVAASPAWRESYRGKKKPGRDRRKKGIASF